MLSAKGSSSMTRLFTIAIPPRKRIRDLFTSGEQLAREVAENPVAEEIRLISLLEVKRRRTEQKRD
jgi:hypothetical protein